MFCFGGRGAQVTVEFGRLAEAGIPGSTCAFLFGIHFRTNLPSVPRAAHALRLTLRQSFDALFPGGGFSAPDGGLPERTGLLTHFFLPL